MTLNQDFYERRMAEERSAAGSATDPIVRDRHIELGNLYAERLRGIARRQSRPLKLIVDNELV